MVINMNQRETDFLDFENELLSTRKKLNDLIYKCSNEYPDSENRALYQDKIYYLETELTYMNRQFRMLRDRQHMAVQTGNVAAKTQDVTENVTAKVPNIPAMQQTVHSVSTPVMTHTVQHANNTAMTQTVPPANNTAMTQTVPPDAHPANTPDTLQNTRPINTPILQNTVKKTEQKDYEKLFGKNFMGIFASVLIFISHAIL